MKILKISLIALLMPLVFVACKKDKDTVSPVEGNWTGLYGNDNDEPSMGYRLNIKHGGIIEELNASGQVKGSGTWSFNGNTLTAHYQWKAPLLTVFSITGSYDPATHKLTGTWGFDEDATNGGKWEVTKNN